MSLGMSSKILKEALLQRREGNAFAVAQEEATALRRRRAVVEEEDWDVHNLAPPSDSQTVFKNDHEEEINEDDEKLLEAFLSRNAAPLSSIADRIIEKLEEQDDNVSSELRPLSKLDRSAMDELRGVGEFLS